MWKETLLYYKRSPYQRLAFFTEQDGSYSMTLDDYWQFNSKNEHVYHECLFTLPALFASKLENVLVLGGGDGLGAKQLLNFPSIKQIDLVDLDPEVIKFAKKNMFMTMLNKNSMNDPRMNVVVGDAKSWLSKPVVKKYDLIIVDFPDPTSELLWDLYTVKLYKKIQNRLAPGGVVAVQSSTYNTRTYDHIFSNLQQVFQHIVGYHTEAPSVFCGFFLCSEQPVQLSRPIPKTCKWINPSRINRLLLLPVAPRHSINNRKGGLTGLAGLGAFGKSAFVPPPASEPAPNAVETAAAQAVTKAPVPTEVKEVAQAVDAIATQLPEEDEEIEEPINPLIQYKNPLILGGAGFGLLLLLMLLRRR